MDDAKHIICSFSPEQIKFLLECVIFRKNDMNNLVTLKEHELKTIEFLEKVYESIPERISTFGS